MAQPLATTRKLANTVSSAPTSLTPVRQDLVTQGQTLGQSIAGAVRPAIAAGDRSAFAPLYSTYQPQVAALRSQWQASEPPSINPTAPLDDGSGLRSSLTGGLDSSSLYG